MCTQKPLPLPILRRAFDDLHRIFALLYRPDTLTCKAVRGIGSGLFIVAKVCGLLGIATSVASELGRGTEFTLRFPVERCWLGVAKRTANGGWAGVATSVTRARPANDVPARDTKTPINPPAFVHNYSRNACLRMLIFVGSRI